MRKNDAPFTRSFAYIHVICCGDVTPVANTPDHACAIRSTIIQCLGTKNYSATAFNMSDKLFYYASSPYASAEICALRALLCTVQRTMAKTKPKVWLTDAIVTSTPGATSNMFTRTEFSRFWDNNLDWNVSLWTSFYTPSLHYDIPTQLTYRTTVSVRVKVGSWWRYLNQHRTFECSEQYNFVNQHQYSSFVIR